MAGDYEAFLVALPPTCLQGPKGQAYLASLGRGVDAFLDRLHQNVLSSFVEVAPVDALGRLGAERLLERYPGETDEGYRTRLLAAVQTWTLGGTREGVLLGLNTGFPGPDWQVIENFEDEELQDPTNWASFRVLMKRPPFARWQWGLRPKGTGFRFGRDGITFGTTATHEQVALIRSLIAKWKGGHNHLSAIEIRFEDGVRLFWPG